MHYYTQQQLLAAARLMLAELDKDNPDFSGIADLLSECSDTLKHEIDRLKATVL
jgi:uncharacterized NAD(P)/FAD-binding protein YdhS